MCRTVSSRDLSVGPLRDAGHLETNPARRFSARLADNRARGTYSSKLASMWVNHIYDAGRAVVSHGLSEAAFHFAPPCVTPLIASMHWPNPAPELGRSWSAELRPRVGRAPCASGVSLSLSTARAEDEHRRPSIHAARHGASVPEHTFGSPQPQRFLADGVQN